MINAEENEVRMNGYTIYWKNKEDAHLFTQVSEVRIVLLDKNRRYATVWQKPLQALCAEQKDVLLAVWEVCKGIAIKAYPLAATPAMYRENGQTILRYTFLCEQVGDTETWQKAETLPEWKEILEEQQALQQQKHTAYAALKEKLPGWYQKNARDFPWRKDTDPYHIWLSEIMLQQTRAAAAIGYYQRFLQELPTIRALAGAEESRVLKLWEGLGYYTRARNLQKAAQQIIEQHNGQFPQTIAEIRALPGIGEYTAGAIGAICFDLPEPAIDGNVLRVLSRVTGDYRAIESGSVKKEMAQSIRESYPSTGRGCFEQSLIELGATVCSPNSAPQCDVCPLRQVCMANKQGSALLLPVRTPKKQRRIEQKTVLLLYCGDKLAVCRRQEKGLLAGLWELPNLPGKLTSQQALDVADTWGVYPLRLQQSLERKHIFTHVEWHMRGFLIQCGQEPETFTWAAPEQLENEIALPSAFKIFLQE